MPHISKKAVILIGIFILALIAIFFPGLRDDSSGPTSSPLPTATTYPKAKSGVEGTITLGPTCPVQRVDQPCPDKPYQTTFLITKSGESKPVAIGQSNLAGMFSIGLVPGSYTMTFNEVKTLPRCAPQTFEVTQDTYTKLSISCDSGIR